MYTHIQIYIFRLLNGLLGWIVDNWNYSSERFDFSTFDPAFMRMELRAVQALHPVIPVRVCLLSQHLLGHSAMLWGVLMPMLFYQLITCLFNIKFQPAQVGAGCVSINDDRFLAKIVGDSQHQDHHNNPRRSRRPDWDLPWWATLAWMRPLGLVW